MNNKFTYDTVNYDTLTEQFKEDGYVVIENLYSKDYCNTLVSQTVDAFEKINPDLDHNNKYTWKKSNLPPATRSGMYQSLVCHINPVKRVRNDELRPSSRKKPSQSHPAIRLSLRSAAVRSCFRKGAASACSAAQKRRAGGARVSPVGSERESRDHFSRHAHGVDSVLRRAEQSFGAQSHCSRGAVHARVRSLPGVDRRSGTSQRAKRLKRRPASKITGAFKPSRKLLLTLQREIAHSFQKIYIVQRVVRSGERMCASSFVLAEREKDGRVL